MIGGWGGRGSLTCNGMYQPTHLGVAQHFADDAGFIQWEDFTANCTPYHVWSAHFYLSLQLWGTSNQSDCSLNITPLVQLIKLLCLQLVNCTVRFHLIIHTQNPLIVHISIQISYRFHQAEPQKSVCNAAPLWHTLSTLTVHAFYFSQQKLTYSCQKILMKVLKVYSIFTKGCITNWTWLYWNVLFKKQEKHKFCLHNQSLVAHLSCWSTFHLLATPSDPEKLPWKIC